MIDGTHFKNAGLDNNGAIYNGYELSSTQKIKIIGLSAWIKLTTNADSAADILIQDVAGDTTIRTYVHPSNNNDDWQKVVLKFSPIDNKPWYGFYYVDELLAKLLLCLTT